MGWGAISTWLDVKNLIYGVGEWCEGEISTYLRDYAVRTDLFV